MIDYSQHGEQEVILKYFAGTQGTFLDIGANDGVTFSNTYALQLMGWRGVLVDASPVAAARLRHRHPPRQLRHPGIQPQRHGRADVAPP
jgi:hypothetical protein